MGNLPFDNANFNLTNFANIYPDVMDSSPKNVEYQYKDANGNIQTKTIANRGKFKQQLWDDVGAALGQFSKTFYVDYVNGDNNNDGSNSSPFKTLTKAISAVPVGGLGVIRILGDYVILDYDCVIYNKTIEIYGSRRSDNANDYTKIIFKRTARDNKHDKFYHIYAKQSILKIYDCNLDLTDPNIVSGSIHLLEQPLGLEDSKFTYGAHDVWISDENDYVVIDAGDNSVCLNIEKYHKGSSAINLFGVKCLFDYTNKQQYFGEMNKYNAALIFTSRSVSYPNDDVKNLIRGVIKDADSGNPINLLSNVNFSD